HAPEGELGVTPRPSREDGRQLTGDGLLEALPRTLRPRDRLQLQVQHLAAVFPAEQGELIPRKRDLRYLAKSRDRAEDVCRPYELPWAHGDAVRVSADGLERLDDVGQRAVVVEDGALREVARMVADQRHGLLKRMERRQHHDPDLAGVDWSERIG